MKIKLGFILLFVIPVFCFGKVNDTAAIKNKFRVYFGVNVFRTYYTGSGYFQIGGALINHKDEYQIQMLYNPEDRTLDLLYGFSIAYYRHFNFLNDRIKLGGIVEMGKGKFYYSWGLGGNILDRLYVNTGLFYGPAISITMLKLKRLRFDLLYHSGFLYAKNQIYFNSLRVNLNYVL